jgi:hypothetical protein
MDPRDVLEWIKKHRKSAASTGVVITGVVGLIVVRALPFFLAAFTTVVWSMEERTGVDRNANGIVDLVYDPYPVNLVYTVNFSTKGGGPPNQWTIQECPEDPCDSSAPVIAQSASATFSAGLQDKHRYFVRARGSIFGIANFDVSSIVQPRNILWVAMGDSYSAGEGNPEASRSWVWTRSDCDDGAPAPGLAAAALVNYMNAHRLDDVCSARVQDVAWADPGLPRGIFFLDGFFYSEFTRSLYYHHQGESTARHRELSFPINMVMFPNGPGQTFEEIDPDADYALRSHRSSYSWPALAATALERADPHTSVTFVHLAASGATVPAGLLGQYAGVDIEPATKRNRYPMRSQLEQAQSLLRCWDPTAMAYRREKCMWDIDILSLSIGLNDIGFQQILYSLAKSKTGVDTVGMSGDEIATAVVTGNWHSFDSDLENASGLENLRKTGGLYDELAGALDQSLRITQVLAVEYPDATHHIVGGHSEKCEKILYDRGENAELWLDAYIDSTEATLVQDFFGRDLNGALEDASRRHGWTYVGGIADRYAREGRGYCAEDPPDPWISQGHFEGTDMYQVRLIGHRAVSWPSPPGIRWMRRWKESYELQGPRYPPPESKGTFHPNEWGHLAVCEQVIAALADRYSTPSGCSSTLSAPR